MFNGELPAVAFQNHLIRFRAHAGVLPEFAMLVFRHYFHSGQFKKIARGSTNLSNLGIRRVERMPFPLPPEPEQRAIVNEARRRLESLERHQETVESAIRQIDFVEKELYYAAVSGRLLPQSSDEEPASVLKERLGLPLTHTLASASANAIGMASMKKSKRDSGHTTLRTVPTLAGAIAGSKRALSLTELFIKAGYDRDSTEQVETFYHALRKELGKTIRVVEPGENALVESDHAP
jgi:type I restriction enzyme S subunit